LIIGLPNGVTIMFKRDQMYLNAKYNNTLVC
jgi:hypothetical protein